MITIANYINGEMIPPVSGNYIDNYDPSTGKVYSLIPDSTEADITLAVSAAQKAFPAWSGSSTEFRHDVLYRISELLLQQLNELAMAESIDNGKPLWLSTEVDIPRSALNFKFFATAIMQFASESHEMPGEALNYTLRQPLGLVGCISPWNLPLYLFTWKIAPALAAGNCVIAKPSEVTPMTAYLLGDICRKAGLPPGVLNIVHGYGHRAGEAIVRHPAIKAISFTGGTRTGAAIAAIAAPQFKKLSLELGGKNPVLIFADCNYEQMLETTVRSSFRNQGQICLCGSRILVEKSIYDRFKTDFVNKVQALKVGDPLLQDSQQGAVVSKQHFEKVLGYIELALSEGGKILCGGHAVKVTGRCEDGWFIAPTILEGLSFDCRTNQEEIFGPVVTIMPFETEEEALMYANSVAYGLASVLWTDNLRKAQRISAKIQSGIVWINCWMLRDLRTPFGGVKDSGIGREGGWEALRFFTETKNVTIKY
jgi:aminomuconate-semialdehyde/2-hydroxymuconate-6-semialdehyde dehydrogenase